jgi:hypothetical protein
MRSLADQTNQELGGRFSVLTRQKQDHAKLARLLDALVGTDGEEQQQVLNRVRRLVFSHAFAEEALLWPALRRELPDGESLTVRVEREHQEITEVVAALDSAAPDDPERPRLLMRTVDMLRRDVRDEEDVLLPRLQEVADIKALRWLGVAWEIVRRMAPTRPHPIVARRPPGNALAAIPLSVIDRSRDRLDSAARRLPTVDRALAASSGLLGAGARRVERLGIMRHGERPETQVPTQEQHP